MSQLFDKSEAASFGFDVADYPLDLDHKFLEDGSRDIAFEPAYFAECYVASKLEIAVEIRSLGADGEQFHLIFCAVPYGSRWHPDKTSPSRIDPCAECTRHDRDEDFVLISNAYLVECEQNLVPSTVWLERAKKRVDFLRRVGTSTFKVRLKSVGVSREGEISVPRIISSANNGQFVNGMVESGSKAIDNSSDDLRPRFRDVLVHAQLVNNMLGLVRVRLDKNGCIVLFIKPSGGFPLEVGEVFLCPCDLAARTIKGSSHD